MPLTVSTRVLSQRSGLSIRQVQTLTDADVLIPDEGTEAPGRGGSRQYPLQEQEVAMLLGAIAHKGMSATEAHGIAMTLRRIIRAPDDLGFKGLEQARGLWWYLDSCIEKRAPADHRYKIEELFPRWFHVEPTETNLRTTQAWITLQLAKLREADPIIFLYRCPDETWLYELWLRAPDAVQLKQVGSRHTNLPRDDQNLQFFDGILIERKSHQSGRGGYVIMPRSVYHDPVSRS
jgi:hypothetical protein